MNNLGDKFFNNYEILTDTGWSKFDGIRKMPKCEIFSVILENGDSVVCNENHFFVVGEITIQLKELIVGESSLDTTSGPSVVKSIEVIGEEEVYDILGIKSNLSAYYSNNILSHNCSFTGSTMTLIDGDILSKLQGDEPPIIKQPWYYIWKNYIPGRVYAFGIDTAHGGGNDYSVINIYDITTYPIDGKYEQVAMYRRNDINIFAFEKETLELTKKWGQPVVICESNEMGLGNVLCEQLYMEDGYERMYYDMETGKGGIQANVKTKKLATTYFKDDVEKLKCKIRSKIQISEMGIFEEKEGSPGTFAARKGRGFNDDTVTSTYWLSYMLKSKWFEDMIEEIYKDPISRQTSIPKDEEKLDEDQLDTFNSIFTSDLDAGGEDFERELWG